MDRCAMGEAAGRAEGLNFKMSSPAAGGDSYTARLQLKSGVVASRFMTSTVVVGPRLRGDDPDGNW